MDNKELIRRLVAFDDGDTSTGYTSVTNPQGTPTSEWMEKCLKDYAMANEYDYEKDLIRDCDIHYDETTGYLYWGEDDFISTDVDTLYELVVKKCPGIKIVVDNIDLKGVSDTINKIIPLLIFEGNDTNYMYNRALTLELWDTDVHDAVINLYNNSGTLESVSIYPQPDITNLRINVNLNKPLRMFEVCAVSDITIAGLVQRDYNKHYGVSFNGSTHTQAKPDFTDITFENCDIQTVKVFKYEDKQDWTLGCNITGMKVLSCVKKVSFYDCPFDFDNHKRLEEFMDSVVVKPGCEERLAELLADCNVTAKNPRTFDLEL